MDKREFPKPEHPFACLSPFVAHMERTLAGALKPVYARCRRCERCRALVRWRWVQRAGAEIRDHNRTWFATWTFGPQARSEILSGAQALGCGLTGTRRLMTASGPFVARALKRFRNGGVWFRYLAIAEAHRDGMPHWHALIHTWPLGELAEDAVWDRSVLSRWPYGRSSLREVERSSMKEVRYVTKYITKGPESSRIRASLQYGVSWLGLDNDDPLENGRTGVDTLVGTG